MSFVDFATKKIAYFASYAQYLLGKGSAPTYDETVDFSKELSAVQNAGTAEQLIQLSNALYDQVALKRTLKLIYKTPKDYYTDYQNYINAMSKITSNSITEIENQHKSVNDTLSVSKSNKSISNKLQKKLSLINPQV